MFTTRTTLTLAAGLLLLSGCAASVTEPSPSSNEAMTSSEGPWYEGLTDVITDTTPLSDTAKKAMPALLREMNLSELASLKEFGGTKDLTQNLCQKIFVQYKKDHSESKIDTTRCDQNLTAAKTYQTEEPFHFIVREFEQKYLLILIQLAGTDAANLYAFAYDLQAAKRTPLDLSGISMQSIYYGEGLLFFTSTDGDETLPAGIYDYENGTLEKI